MARRLRDSGPDAVLSLRAGLRVHFAARAVRNADRGRVDGHARHVVDALDAGERVVLAGWTLARFHLPEVHRGRHAFYRVEPDGRLLEVVARRDLLDGMSVVAWDVA